MYTHCPHCDTFFRVTSEQLKSAEGNVRCGRCFGTFNALKHLVDEPPEKTKKPSPTPPVETEEAAATQSGKIATPQTSLDNQEVSIDEEIEITAPDVSLPETKPTDIKRDHSQQLIESIQEQQISSDGSGKRILWSLLSIPLLLLLAGQYAYFNLDSLSQNTQLRPALKVVCSIAACEVPLLKATHMVKLTERDIRAHDTNKDVLVVKAVIQNNADFAQPFPLMQLLLQDITGHIMTGRRFTPDEYLADKSINIAAGIGPKQSHAILLEMVDPGKEAVGFEFEFF